MSHLHVEWLRATEVEEQGWFARWRLQKYLETAGEPKRDGDDGGGQWFDPDFLQVDRILDTCDVAVDVDGTSKALSPAQVSPQQCRTPRQRA